MLFKAKSRNVRISPYKLRPYVDAIRSCSVKDAFSWLKVQGLDRIKPIIKVIHSAYSNAKDLDSEIKSMDNLLIKEIKVDQGPIVKYHKPGAMGRACVQRKRLCHIEVILKKSN
jgi:large subunit ribosomal protein L22